MDDALLLGELLSNLLDNALRYSPDGTRVTVRLWRDQEGPCLEVEDSGPGIPEGERQRVFERFYRVPGSGAEGSGLGLAIVSMIAEGHGGRVALGDGEAGGLRVTVRFPPPPVT
ncbi:MAG: sensor histidine kinase [Candidatus Competibacteraceae bacterium]|nr:sensor histidine kinase [Candidatus Competibacteraceae bacterium]